jgi:hypothetical protein
MIFERHDLDGMHFELSLSSGFSENESRAGLVLTLLGKSLSIRVPRWVCPPKARYVDLSKYDWAATHKDGSKGYWAADRRKYGIWLFQDHLNVAYGLSTDDSSTEQRWSAFLPWTQWRFVRHTLYDPQWRAFAQFDDLDLRHVKDREARQELRRERWRAEDEARRAVPKVFYSFKDYDGESVRVQCTVEKRVWVKGTGWFSWLKYLVKPQVRYSLDLRFSKEIGPRKGSWKGGTLGHGCEISDGESIRDSFNRYATEHGFTEVDVCGAWLSAPDPEPVTKG